MKRLNLIATLFSIVAVSVSTSHAQQTCCSPGNCGQQTYVTATLQDFNTPSQPVTSSHATTNAWPSSNYVESSPSDISYTNQGYSNQGYSNGEYVVAGSYANQGSYVSNAPVVNYQQGYSSPGCQGCQGTVQYAAPSTVQSTCSPNSTYVGTYPAYSSHYAQPAYSQPVCNQQVYSSYPSSQPHYSQANVVYSGQSQNWQPATTYAPQQQSYQPCCNQVQGYSSPGYQQTYQQAQPQAYQQAVVNYRPTSQRQYTATSNRSRYASISGVGGLAQRKAQQAASRSLKGHVGGGLGGAKYEGVGWSTSSANQAVQACCYWGTRPVAEIGVTRGNDGWYACVLYH